ncbi:MAG: hypothetical protein WAS73_14205, partial [Defluviicoccus sp.]
TVAPAVPPAAPPAPPAPITALPYEEAFLKAANALFAGAQLQERAGDASGRHLLVIDPLVDGVTGNQSAATRSMEARLVDLARAQYPQFDVQSFSSGAVAAQPIVFVGTFTGVNPQGKTAGQREAYRICFALADLKSGKIVAKSRVFAEMEGVDVTPTPAFRDSPAWVKDEATEAYIKTCQATKVGDPLDPAYVDRILAAALISDAIEAYDARRYQDALELYTSAQSLPAGDQLRVHNGIYLTNWKLGRRDAAMAAFGRLIDFGLANKRLAVMFLFKPGSTAFWPDPQVSAPYTFWLQEIAARGAQAGSCLEITGHTSPTGPEPLNERLSLLRAEVIKKRLEAGAPTLAGRTIANGVGSREALVGNGRDDQTDALDRRVEFKVIGC